MCSVRLIIEQLPIIFVFVETHLREGDMIEIGGCGDSDGLAV